MWVIKIGGSLQDSEYLQPWLEAVVEHGGGRAAVVPGGGRFADEVRQRQQLEGFDDDEAHERALRAMDQFASCICDYSPRLVPAQSRQAIRTIQNNNHVSVWLPGGMVCGNPALPASWDVTSDSLALWLAQQLSADGLLLVKSASVDDISRPEGLAGAGIIDAYFPELYQKQPVNLRFYSARQHHRLRELLDWDCTGSL